MGLKCCSGFWKVHYRKLILLLWLGTGFSKQRWYLRSLLWSCFELVKEVVNLKSVARGRKKERKEGREEEREGGRKRLIPSLSIKLYSGKMGKNGYHCWVPKEVLPERLCASGTGHLYSIKRKWKLNNCQELLLELWGKWGTYKKTLKGLGLFSLAKWRLKRGIL